MSVEYAITLGGTVRDAIGMMHDYNRPAVGVVDAEGVLCGLFTNGDMRHFFLEGGQVNMDIEEAMNPEPVCFYSREDIAQARAVHSYIVYPLLDSAHKLIELVFDNAESVPRTNKLQGVPLVLMAGGKGTRLLPYTKIIPKALIPLDDRTVSENIIDQFYRHGCRDVYFILNYKAGMIRAYFDDLDPDYRTVYVQEDSYLGTGGGLSLLRGAIDSTFILSNCDILIQDDLSSAYACHRRDGNDITLVCAMMNVSIPYGVVDVDRSGRILGMKEKPEISKLVNTGVYIVEPDVMDLIDDNEPIDFPDVAKRCMDKGGRVGVFPISENAWMDIGELNKMHLAAKQFNIES
jgi:dTDP-glucose pyrophosphorylase